MVILDLRPRGLSTKIAAAAEDTVDVELFDMRSGYDSRGFFPNQTG